MDDLKIYTANEEQLQKLIALTHCMSDDIGMLFGTKNCKILGIERGKLEERNKHYQQISALRDHFYSGTHHHPRHKIEKNGERKNYMGNFITSYSRHLLMKSRAAHGLSKGALYPEKEGFMLTIQDQVVSTRNYMKHIIKRV